MRILIVDDDYVSRTKLKSLLSKYGDCDAVPNGEMAFEMFKVSHDELAPFNLITMDMDMPKIRGPEVVKKIREFEESNEVSGIKKVKILVITGKRNCKDIVSSLGENGEFFLFKPVNSENIEKALEFLEH